VHTYFLAHAEVLTFPHMSRLQQTSTKPPELWDSHPCSRGMQDSLTPAAAVRCSLLQGFSVTACQR